MIVDTLRPHPGQQHARDLDRTHSSSVDQRWLRPEGCPISMPESTGAVSADAVSADAVNTDAGDLLRPKAGRRVNAARTQVQEAFDARRALLEAERDERVLVEEAVDVTLPFDRTPRGARHPITQIGERIADVFVAMGYEVAEGPEAESS